MYDKLDGGLVTFVDADADDPADDVDDVAEYEDEYAGEKSAAEFGGEGYAGDGIDNPSVSIMVLEVDPCV